MYQAIVRHRIRSLFAQLSLGNWRPIVDGLGRPFSYRFAGVSPLSGSRNRRASMEAWFVRLLKLFPLAQFEVGEIVVNGMPWNTRVMTHVRIRARVPLSAAKTLSPYENEFMQFLRIRWGKVVQVITIEDTQKFAGALGQMNAAGTLEAGLSPIEDSPQ
jgi:ketosteroid isomerase-like protein